jgi:hypothetical protein
MRKGGEEEEEDEEDKEDKEDKEDEVGGTCTGMGRSA